MRTTRLFLSFIMSMALLPIQPFRSSAECRELTSGTSEATVVMGRPAPGFSLKDLEGHNVNLRQLQGKIVLIDFWAGWCAPCRREMPTLEKLHRELRDRGLVVLAINVESFVDAKKVLAENGYSFRTLIDEEGEVARSYQVDSIPSLFLINRTGKVVAHHVGLQSEITLRNELVNELAKR